MGPDFWFMRKYKPNTYAHDQVMRFMGRTWKSVQKQVKPVLETGKKVSDAANWSLQFPPDSSITLAKTPGFEYMGGGRVYGECQFTQNNDSPITSGPSSSSIGSLEFGPENISFKLGESSIGRIASALNINFSDNFFRPWSVDVSWNFTVRKGDWDGTGTLGYEYVARPDNLSLSLVSVAVGWGVYELFSLIPFTKFIPIAEIFNKSGYEQLLNPR